MASKKTAKLIEFGNQKGGVGKSTLCSMLANYLHSKNTLDIIVIDCDDTQKSLNDERLRELAVITKQNPKFDFNSVYRIVKIHSSEFPSYYYENLINSFDIVLVDFPGNIKQEGVIASHSLCDTIIVPFNLTGKDIASTQLFIKECRDKIANFRLKNGLPEQKMYGVLAKVEASSIEYKDYLDGGKEFLEKDFGFHMLDNFMPYNRVAFQRNSSTIEVYEKDEYNALCEEIISKY
jgi:cellulose biosynthesis protein BcsQ